MVLPVDEKLDYLKPLNTDHQCDRTPADAHHAAALQSVLDRFETILHSVRQSVLFCVCITTERWCINVEGRCGTASRLGVEGWMAGWPEPSCRRVWWVVLYSCDCICSSTCPVSSAAKMILFSVVFVMDAYVCLFVDTITRKLLKTF